MGETKKKLCSMGAKAVEGRGPEWGWGKGRHGAEPVEVMREQGPKGGAMSSGLEKSPFLPQATHVLATHPHFPLGSIEWVSGPCN